jgi:carbonic anhydrase
MDAEAPSRLDSRRSLSILEGPMNRIGRARARTLARLAVLAMSVTAVPVAGAASPAAAEAHASAPALAPEQALARLTEGNQRFVAGTPVRPHQGREWRAGLVAGQHPIAAVLGCSDSRAPVEELFDQGFGDLFVIRVAGNVASEDERGSIEYAVAHLGVPLVLVLGHEGCGAVTAALSPESERQHEAPEIQTLLTRIAPALEGMTGATPEERVHRGVEANARLSVRQLLDTPLLKERIAGKTLQVEAGVYELATGRVRLLD